MKRSNLALLGGILLGVVVCVSSVVARLRFSEDVDEWAIRLLIFPCFAAAVLSFIVNMLAQFLLNETVRSLKFRGIDIDAQLKKIADEGTAIDKALVTVLDGFEFLANILAGYFVSSIFLVPYLVM